MHYTVLLLIRTPFYVLLVFVAMYSLFCFFFLVKLSVLAKWLARKIERLLWGSLIVARGSSPESPGRRVRMIFLVYCIASLFYYIFVLSPALTWYIISYCYGVMVPLNPKQTNKPQPTRRRKIWWCQSVDVLYTPAELSRRWSVYWLAARV